MSSPFSFPGASCQKRLLDLADSLQDHGSQRELGVTQGVVIGNQSSGKSSVVEAISGIGLPQDTGTCTRCSTRIRLTPAERFLARVSVHHAGAKPRRVGDPITDKSKIEDVVRRAQLEALNPELDVDELLTAPAEKIKELTLEQAQHTPFTQNTVSVMVEGPGLIDLSFVDLPGLVQNAPSNVVSFVEKMVVDHTQGNAIILVVLPMTDDLENQKALRLARTEDPQGSRTIGVLTKPDLLGPGSITALANWKDVLEGRGRHPLELGYFCTRQPDDAERASATTPAQIRENEKAFFRSTQPWTELTRQGQLGIENITLFLNAQLVKRIDENLPRITQEAEKRLRECKKELDKLPKPIEEPVAHLLNLVTTFSDEIKLHVRGNLEAASLIQTQNEVYQHFMCNIARTVPNFAPYLDTERYYDFANSLDQEKEDEDTLVFVNSKNAFNIDRMSSWIEQSKTRELPRYIPFEAVVGLILQFQEDWDSHMLECLQAVDDSIQKLLHDTVKGHFSRHESLKRFVGSILGDLAERKRNECQSHLKLVLKSEKTPRTLHQRDYQELTKTWEAKFRSLRQRDQSTVRPQSTLASTPSPSHRPAKPLPKRREAPTSSFTQSQPLAPEGTSRSNTPFSIFNFARSNPNLAHASQSSSAESSWTQKDDDELNAVLSGLNTNDYEDELRTMAEVRSYFEISFKRVVDVIPSLIDLCFVKGLAEEVQPYLVMKLGLCTTSASEKCAKFLAEDASVAAKREALMSRKTMLQNVLQELRDFGLQVDTD
ncbi:hypothetical protein K435DRAFT_973183 [Dendrothele bispora CBS 962.96]|uniref:P-loop containing nucleoside triphosphate hydrolase protein n=1 Tax=Dendrothele bispora (strain CBS 962.96) TaxID=1314807 RepID=A0A4S8KU72_DENBC|nr:hypothetical protein K435DRAFT_973183 [Dendrothele bispora CBS 962.96]